jgi:hypothetical protein
MGNMEMLVMNIHNYIHITGWWFQPVEKYESQFGLFFSIYIYTGKNKKHQPVIFLCKPTCSETSIYLDLEHPQI